MNKKPGKLLSLLLCLCLLFGSFLPVRAQETEMPEETGAVEEAQAVSLSISTAEELLAFAESCRLDSFSRNLAVTLEKDIDLTGLDFAGVPIFSGSFDGKGHVISGLEIQTEGSVLGLFRYLQPGSRVCNLTVKGSVTPEGSAAKVGGIAGSNGGTVENCAFQGTVAGSEDVGGIVGVNTLTGILENCVAAGSIVGSHFVGGIAGENRGVIRSCSNGAQINTTAAQNTVELSDITLDTLTGSESVNTVTDIGGIAGESSGVIRACENRGAVGYKHMGYNIGGIAGTQSGYIVDCVNYGEIAGRKEAGGIVGQMEPVTNITYTEDTLQILREQTNTLQGLTDRASANAQSNAANISGQVGKLQDQAQTMKDSVDILMPDVENPELPDADSIQAAQNNLTSALNSMPGTLNSLSAAVQGTMGTLARDLNAVSSQVSAISGTLNAASENLGGSLTDISDSDTADLLTGKVENCQNHGTVLADINSGGIAGTVAVETDLDTASDLEFSGESSLNFTGEVRAVILNCENTAQVTAQKQYSGGIVGGQLLGLIKNCRNTGPVRVESGDYAGGIAGTSAGFIRDCSVKCLVNAGSYAGGIAGHGDTVSGCRVMVQVTGTEKLGAVLGFAEVLPGTGEAESLQNNFYLPVGWDMGAVDGISYDGCAQPLDREAFFGLEDLPQILETVTLRFVFEDGTARQVSLMPGGALEEHQIPAVPEKEGHTGIWEGLEETDLTNVTFDGSFTLSYTKKLAVIESEARDSGGRPILLAQGEFMQGSTLTVTEQTPPALADGETVRLSCGFAVSEGSVQQLRVLLEQDGKRLRLLLLDDSGSWTEAEFAQDESYRVFAVTEDTRGFCFVEIPADNTLQIGAVAVVLLGMLLAVIFRRKRK